MPPASLRPVGRIALADPCAADVRALLRRHLAFANANSAPEDVHALEVEALADPAVWLYGYRAGGELLGVAALKRLDDGHAEIKSMHTAEAARGQRRRARAGRALLAIARERGFRRVSLETGAGPAFVPARSLYASAGFEECGPFGDYAPSPNSAFMTIAL